MFQDQHMRIRSWSDLRKWADAISRTRWEPHIKYFYSGTFYVLSGQILLAFSVVSMMRDERIKREESEILSIVKTHEINA